MGGTPSCEKGGAACGKNCAGDIVSRRDKEGDGEGEMKWEGDGEFLISTVRPLPGWGGTCLGMRGPMGRPRGPGLSILVGGSMKGRGGSVRSSIVDS